MGDFGALAAKNVRRNPARIAAIAFLIAFIIGYGVQVTGKWQANRIILVRQVKSSVGADISIGVVNATASFYSTGGHFRERFRHSKFDNAVPADAKSTRTL